MHYLCSVRLVLQLINRSQQTIKPHLQKSQRRYTISNFDKLSYIKFQSLQICQILRQSGGICLYIYFFNFKICISHWRVPSCNDVFLVGYKQTL